MAKKYYENLNGVTVEMSPKATEIYVRQAAEWDAGENDRKLEQMRLDRNDRLKATDFYSLSDVPMSDAMKNYRQALRDLPAADDPFTFPARPDE